MARPTKTVLILCAKPEHARNRFEREIRDRGMFNCDIDHEKMTLTFPDHKLKILVMCATSELRGLKCTDVIFDEWITRYS